MINLSVIQDRMRIDIHWRHLLFWGQFSIIHNVIKHTMRMNELYGEFKGEKREILNYSINNGLTLHLDFISGTFLNCSFYGPWRSSAVPVHRRHRSSMAQKFLHSTLGDWEKAEGERKFLWTHIVGGHFLRRGHTV